jgi:hypothetical protein
MSDETKTVEPPADGTQVADTLNGDGADPTPEAAATAPALDPVTEDQVEAAAAGEPAAAVPPPIEVAEVAQVVEATEPEALPAEPEADAHVEPDVPADLPVVVPTGPRTVGRYVADALRAAGVRYAFTVPGESFLGLLEGLAAAGIRVIATRHEGGASFMAEAHAQLTGRPAAALGTRAVGAANMAIGIHTARQNSTPMFALVGQVERAFKGREAFQEVDQVESFGRLTKFAAEPASAGDVPGVLDEAIRQALGGRPGPVLL